MRRLRPLGVLAALSLALAGLFAPRLAAVVADPLAGQKQASGQHGSAHEASVNEDPAGARDVRLDCVSYSPYRHPGTSPWQPGVARLEQTLERDLRQLSTITGCVRTYGTSGGLDQVPAIAKRLGMTVWLGAWIGREAERNAQEIETAIAGIKAMRARVGKMTVAEILSARHEGHKY
jgi:exo-beta-1,3-glucanase (GH17 family)